MSHDRLSTYPSKDSYGRTLFSLSIPSLDTLPKNLSLPTPHFVCLLACDAQDIPNAAIIDFANVLIDQGLAYFCAWGPECSRVEAYVDFALVDRDIATGIEHPLVLTTSHAQDSLDKALWYLLNLAYPVDGLEASGDSTLAISVDNKAWDSQIQKRLANPAQLIADVVDKKDD